MLVPDIFGLRPLMEDICRRLATHGLAVCAPETFARLIPPDGVARHRGAPGPGRRSSTTTSVMEDLAEAADHLAAADGVGTVAVMGFCMGGSYTLKAAATGRFERAVAFYGMVRTPEMWAGGGQRDALDVVAGACPTLAIFGEVDPSSRRPTSTPCARLGRAGRPQGRRLPGADHAFAHDPDRPVHRPDDAADAWHRCLAFLLD